MTKSQKSLLEKLIATLVINIFSFNILIVPVLAASAAADTSDPSRTPNVHEKNGVTVVDIAGPNAQGLSHNKYLNFNVDQNGLILNNATSGANTHLAGNINANANLNGRAATLILNEVTGTGRSHINGMIEIAGQKADVIIANPNGISGGSFGFINAGRATLTTGVPVYDQNNQLGFEVTQGSISINGAGTDDYYQPTKLDILARAVEINAEVWAQEELNIITGANKINYEDLNIAEQLAPTEQEKPSVALDVGALGGMYAGKIRLIGTEAGLGVSVLGEITAEKDLVLDSKGKITIVNQVDKDNLDNSAMGLISAREGVTIATTEDFVNSGLVESNKALTISADNVENNGMLLAGSAIIEENAMNEDVELDPIPADLTVTATGSISGSGMYDASRDVKLTGEEIVYNPMGISAEKLYINGVVTEYDPTGHIPEKPKDDSDDPDLSDPLNNKGSNQYELPETPDSPEIQETKFVAVEKESNLALVADREASGGNVAIIDKAANGVDLVQITTATAGGVSRNYYSAFNINPTGLILNNSTHYTYTQLGGYIDGNGMLGGITAKVILNEVTGGGISRLNGFLEVAGAKADVVIANQNGIVVNGFGYINAGNATLTTKGSFIVQGDGLNANTTRNLYIDAGRFANNYSELWGQNVYISSASSLTNTGKLISENDMELAAENIQNSDRGMLLSRGDMLLIAEQNLVNDAALVQSEQDLTVSAKNIANQNKAVILTSQDSTLLGDSFANSNNSSINTEGDLYLQAKNIKNDNRSIIKTEKDAVFIGDNLTNSGNSAISSGQDTYVQMEGEIRNQDKSVLMAGRDADLISNSFVNSNEAALSVDRDLYLDANDVKNQDASLILAGQDATFISESWSNSNSSAVASGQDTYIKAKNLTNQTDSVIMTGQDLIVQTGSFDNLSNASVFADGQMYLEAEGTVNNKDAILFAGDDLTIVADEINNTSNGLIYAVGDLALEASGDILNQSSNLESQKNINITARNLTNEKETFVTEWIITYQPISYTIAHLPQANYYKAMRSFLREIKTANIVEESATAKILAEGGIYIQVENDFINHYSIVSAVDDLYIQAGNKVENYGYQGSIIFIDRGNDYHYWKYKKHRRFHAGCKMVYGTTIIPYYHWEENATNVSRHGILSAGGTVSIDANTVINEMFNAGGETPVIEGGIAAQTYDPHVRRNLGSSIDGQLQLQDKRFNFNNDPEAKYLVETDPRFANYKDFLSSDYLFERIVSDHEKVMKRLGDGYYEQMLITEQITNLTGRKYLSGYSSELEQYKALMDNAVMVAEQFNLTIGVALTAEQIAALTTDIVWFVEEIVNGESVLVPYVYLSSLRTDDLTTGGAIILGNDVQILTKDKLENIGTIKADNKLVAVSEGDIINRGGTMQGEDVYLGAGNNIENIGGLITGGDVALQAENIINRTTTNTVNYNGLEQTTISQTAGIIAENNLTLEAQNQVLNQGAVLSAGENLNISAKDVIIESVAEEYRFATVQGEASVSLYEKAHSGSVLLAGNMSISADDVTIKGSVLLADENISIQAENNLNILADKDISQSDLSIGSRGSSYFDRSMENHESVSGSLISAGNDISLEAGRDLTIKGSDVQSSEGKIALRGENVNILNETELHESLREHEQKSSGLLSSKSTKIYDYQSVDYVVGSNLSGREIEITSANDTNIKGSFVLADEDININAGGNINIESAQQNSESYYKKEVKKSGLLSGGGLGFSIGSEKEKLTQSTKNVEQVGSMVGSLNGNVSLNAEEDVNIRASDIFAGQDINIEGNSVNIESADHIYNFNSKYEYKKTGLTVSLGGKAISAFNNIYQPLQRASEAKTDQLKTMGTLKGGWSAYKAYKGGLFSKNAFSGTNLDTNLRVSIAFGSTKITSETDAVTTIAQGSNISAGGDVNIKAREKDINIIGSNISGENVTLEAKENVNIEASANTNASSTDSSSSSSSIGVNVGIGKGFGGSIGVDASYNKNKGKVRGNGTSWNESTITANDKLTIKSGEDTNIIGSQVKGDRVEMEVGGNLNIESLQDTENYSENNKTSGGSISSNLGKGSKPSGQLGSQNQNINSDYASVQEQAGIYAGEGGFDIYVEGNTDLKGAVIASEADAEDNKLSTGTLTYSDIENHAEYEANTSGNSIGMSDGKVDLIGAGLGALGGSLAGSEGEASSTTHSAIAEGEIEIRDNPDQDISDLSRDTDNANNPLSPIFDRDKVLEKQEAAAYFGEMAFGLIGDIAKRMKWAEGSAEKILLHGLIAGLMAEINGGKFGDGLTVGMLNEILVGILDKNRDALGLSDNAIKAISNLVGQAVGGHQGGAIAESATTNNYILHIENDYSKLSNAEKEEMQRRLDECDSEEEKEAIRNEYSKLNADYAAIEIQNKFNVDGNNDEVKVILGPDGKYYVASIVTDDDGSIKINKGDGYLLTEEEFNKYGPNVDPPRIAAEKQQRAETIKYFNERGIELGGDFGKEVVFGLAEGSLGDLLLRSFRETWTIGQVAAPELGAAATLEVKVGTSPGSTVAMKNLNKVGIVTAAGLVYDVYLDYETYGGVNADFGQAVAIDFTKVAIIAGAGGAAGNATTGFGTNTSMIVAALVGGGVAVLVNPLFVKPKSE